MFLDKIISFLLYVYIVFLPIDASLPKVAVFQNILNVLCLIIITLLFLRLFIKNRLEPINNKALILYFIYFLFSFIFSVLNGIEVGSGVTFIIYGFLLLLLLLNRFSLDENKLLLTSISTLVIILIYVIDKFNFNYDARLNIDFGNYMDPNYFSSNLILLTFTFSYFLSREKKVIKIILFLIPIILVLFVIFLTGSRGALISHVVLIFVNILFSFRKKGNFKKFVFGGMLILVLFIVLLPYVPKNLLERFNIQVIIDSQGTGRYSIWKEALSIYSTKGLVDNIFGIGFGSTKFFPTLGKVMHNSWLQSLFEGGIIGLILMFSFMFMIFESIVKEKNSNKIALFVGVNIILLSLDFHYTRTFWFILYILMNKDIFRQRKRVKLEENVFKYE